MNLRLLVTLPALLSILWSPWPALADATCVAPGQWIQPGPDGWARSDGRVVIDAAGAARVVLLGENHADADHHRWQLHMLAALHARHPDLTLALEMFPRAVQPVLDRWVRGELDEREFLTASRWSEVWTYDAQFYLPLFHFARMHRIPMIGVNVDRALVREIRARGFDAIAESSREGIGKPMAAPAAYRDFLFGSFRHHGAGDGAASSSTNSVEFQHFVEAQLTWDRAMAEGIAAVLRDRPGTRVVGLLGAGHVLRGWGVPAQLRALGVTDVQSLLAWDSSEDCADLPQDYASALFGVMTPQEPATDRPRLGLLLDPGDGGVMVKAVEPGSIAAAAGIRVGDLLTEVAGRASRKPADIAAAVQRQAPGTWLPLTLRRGSDTLAVIARFPPESTP
ncbi:MAG: ChaN family lipoprotein [Burkholderiales bacterium]|nr:ChaN family lipoprotein [Burkholderiales bacterium]